MPDFLGGLFGSTFDTEAFLDFFVGAFEADTIDLRLVDAAFDAALTSVIFFGSSGSCILVSVGAPAVAFANICMARRISRNESRRTSGSMSMWIEVSDELLP